MKKATLLAALAAATLLGGCASTGTPTGDRHYSEDNSRAYNLAQAGGLRDAKDTKLGNEEYSELMSNMAGGASTALSLSSSSGFGLSGGASLGLGLASAIFSGPGMMGRDSAFAFVPSNEAESPEHATDVIRDHFYEAVQGVADSTEFTMHYNEGERDVRYSRQRNISAIYLVNEEMGCPIATEEHRGKDVCVFALFTPNSAGKLQETPLAVKTSSSPYSYPYSANDHVNSLLVTMHFSDKAKEAMGEDQAAIKRIELLSKLSEEMPSWFYMYIKAGDQTPPMILEDGKAELFISRH